MDQNSQIDAFQQLFGEQNKGGWNKIEVFGEPSLWPHFEKNVNPEIETIDAYLLK